ncbi:MAG: ATP-binding protein [Candidatus Omnitrophica bacterium]|nr:ATP-binding protein [Candidatus Omnitrophota bacterium]
MEKLKKEINQPEINIILGARQVGKTTLLRQLQKIIEQSGRTTHFFDLEQPQVLAEFNQNPQEIINKIRASGQTVFIDEFQYIKNASKIFKAIYDDNIPIKIFCSGSSSLEIHKHLKESLAGRRFLFRLYPLQLSEIVSPKKKYSLRKYLQYGGMPGLTKTLSDKRKQQILSELLSSYILKDIKSLIKEENIRAFNHLLYLLAENQGAAISVNSLSNQIRLSSKAVNRYLDILEETYVNFRIYSFSKNLGNELKKSCKTYLFDLGIRNAILKDFSRASDRPDKGVIFESFVFLKLQTIIEPNMEIKFWRTKDGDEVDFILLKNRKPVPIEVKSKLAKPKIPKGLKRFLLRYKNIKHAYVINETITDSLKHDSCVISFITFEQFDKKISSNTFIPL